MQLWRATRAPCGILKAWLTWVLRCRGLAGGGQAPHQASQVSIVSNSWLYVRCKIQKCHHFGNLSSGERAETELTCSVYRWFFHWSHPVSQMHFQDEVSNYLHAKNENEMTKTLPKSKLRQHAHRSGYKQECSVPILCGFAQEESPCSLQPPAGPSEHRRWAVILADTPQIPLH